MLNQITVEDVTSVYAKLLSHGYGRLNIKIFSKKEWEADKKADQDLNAAYYAKLGVKVENQ